MKHTISSTKMANLQRVSCSENSGSFLISDSSPTTERLIPVRNSNGFTLFELLVVVTVIMVLISFLMPVIASIRNQSKLVVCASNLRQWGVVIQGYAQDNRGQIPESAPTYYDLNPGNRTYWAVLKVQQAANPAWISFTAIQPYFNDDPAVGSDGLPRFWNCSATIGGDQGTAYQYVYWTSYVYMGRVSSWASLASDPS